MSMDELAKISKQYRLMSEYVSCYLSAYQHKAKKNMNLYESYLKMAEKVKSEITLPLPNLEEIKDGTLVKEI